MAKKKQDKTRIVQIWGDILDQGFTSVPNILLRYRSYLGIKSHHLALVIDIMSFKWDADNPFPSYSALAEKAGVTERGIMKTIQDLERLSLLKRTQRFDEETGAQITTIFDFRPLVQKLTDETQKASLKQTSELWSSTTTNTIGDELQFKGGMNYSSGGGVNYSSPKEYTNTNKTHINKIVNVKNVHTLTKTKEKNDKKTKKIKTERVSKHFRDGIFRKRLFEIYDNLRDIKSIDELVEEGAYKACREIITSKASFLHSNNIEIKPDIIAKEVKIEFPYKKIPKEVGRARAFFVSTLCNLTVEKISVFMMNLNKN